MVSRVLGGVHAFMYSVYGALKDEVFDLAQLQVAWYRRTDSQISNLPSDSLMPCKSRNRFIKYLIVPGNTKVEINPSTIVKQTNQTEL